MNLDPSFSSKSTVIPFPVAPKGVDLPSFSRGVAEPGPIETEMRAKVARLKDCRYPDSFDWSVYDRIAKNFETPPRGGVVFGTTFKLVNWHPTCSKCHYAFEVDTYGRGCFHNCGYCYAKDRLTSRGYWNAPQPFPVDLAEIRKIFFTVFETDKNSKWREILTNRIPLRIGSMSDSFMWLDTKYGVTKEFMKILRFYQYPNIVFTRSDLVAHDDYMSVLDPKLTAVQFSISGNNKDLIRRLEPGAPNVKRRLQAISKLSNAGFWTAVRINPLFPQYPDGHFSNSESYKRRFGSMEKVPELTLIDNEFIPQIAQSGAKTVLAGFVRLSGHAVDSVARAADINFRSFFETYNPGNSDNSYSPAEIAMYYASLHKQAKQCGIRFTTCYIGTGLEEYFKHQKMWSNKTDCCDVQGHVKSFNASSQQIDWKTRTAHSQFKHLAHQAEEAEFMRGNDQSPLAHSNDSRIHLSRGSSLIKSPSSDGSHPPL